MAGINVKTMLNVDDLTGNVVIDKNGYAYYESDPTTKLSKNKITGIYSKQGLDNILTTDGTRIKGNDAIFKLTNEGSLAGHTITVKDYFKKNGKSSFVNVTQVVDDEVKGSLNIIDDGLLYNKNLYNYYNLAENHNGKITKSTIQGTVFNDTVDLSEFTEDELVDSKNKALKSITIKTDKGNDTITGSIINDNITGGAGENTLNFTDYSDKIAADSAYGDDIYNLTSGETLNLAYAGTDRESNLSYAKVGNDIVITDTVTNSVEYTRTKITGDTVAIRYLKEDVKYDTKAIAYTKVVVTGDTEATEYTKVVVEANSTPESEGSEHAGKYAKVTKTYEEHLAICEELGLNLD